MMADKSVYTLSSLNAKTLTTVDPKRKPKVHRKTIANLRWMLPLIVSFVCFLVVYLSIGDFRATLLFAQSVPASKLKLDTGSEIYHSGCVACHGPDGKGQAQSLAGFERPATFPDFTDCPTATPEPDIQWRAVITN